MGRNFWLFRAGQLISLLGDSCSSIALAWWILGKTGSAAQMSSVLAPAMAVRIFLVPLFGPFGDRYSRRRLIVAADSWRFAISAVLATMVFFDHFELPLLIALFMLNSVGSALFDAASSGMTPRLVRPDQLQAAMQQTQTISSFAGILGGIAGGVVVSFTGVFGAFAIDAVSFLGAALFTAAINADTKPVRAQTPKEASRGALREWRSELADGFRLLFRVPVLLWLCVVAMFMNLAMSPFSIVLPVLVKEGRGMPAWFLGALESSIGVGSIVGAISIGYVMRRWSGHWLVMIGIAMIGTGVMLLPLMPTAILPLGVMFWLGVGATWSNIPIGTQISLALPDHYRSRLGSIMNFMCTGIAPLGVAASGLLISAIGLVPTLIVMGGGVVLLTPLLLLIPKLKDLLNSTPDESASFLERHYPAAL